MEIATERLYLRPFEKRDAEDMYVYLSDPEVVRFEPYAPYTRAMCDEEAANRAENPNFIAVEWHGHVIGNIWLGRADAYTFEIGWVFNRLYQGKGYAAEAARAVIGQAFSTQGAHRVIALCDPHNAPSCRLCERLGMRREAHMKKNVFFFRDEKGCPIWKDTIQYAVLDEEWNEK